MLKPFLVMLLLFFALSGCGVTSAKPEAEALVAQYFNAIKSGAFDEAARFFSEKPAEENSREELLNDLKDMRSQLGTLEDYELVHWGVTVTSQKSAGGTFVSLVYRVKYSLYETQETFIVLKPLTGGPAAISRHEINSKRFASPGVSA